ncbi:hypothetical protein BYZ73_01335 [Rhodovulum viride]|uniref:DUF1330 domain-containing protein n=1 Tax=Rhodovulum viride TaxID=1231134 RepID=A0ABX9DMH4_9RHOB|nr:DUF1330 domain-containing protein [Rhodovulum viride]RAP43378.1 hypothetical protein BYZ73_01335 [Rhodovulum viride]
MRPAGHFVLEPDPQDPARIVPHAERVAAAPARFGGWLLATGGRTEAVEGRAPEGKIVRPRFGSMDSAPGWYRSEAHAEIRVHRLAAGRKRGYFVERLPG